jgi:hypothetical protein
VGGQNESGMVHSHVWKRHKATRMHDRLCATCTRPDIIRRTNLAASSVMLHLDLGKALVVQKTRRNFDTRNSRRMFKRADRRWASSQCLKGQPWCWSPTGLALMILPHCEQAHMHAVRLASGNACNSLFMGFDMCFSRWRKLSGMGRKKMRKYDLRQQSYSSYDIREHVLCEVQCRKQRVGQNKAWRILPW